MAAMSTKMYRKLKQMSSNECFCSSGSVLYLALRPCLLIILVAVLQQAVGVAGFGTSCPRFVGNYRDCTCGVKYRDIEERCCNGFTCYEPILRSENFSCPFECQNGGIRNTGVGRPCLCKSGYYGLCCQNETFRCGENFVEPKGEFKSPLFPNSYPNSIRCVWKIATDPYRSIALGVKDDSFDVEQGSSIYSCNHDSLSVYDGENKTARRLGTYCGNGMRTFHTVSSTGRHLYVEFKADWQQRRGGFHLQYVTYFTVEPCGRTVFARPTNIITSPQYPLEYRPSQRCVYEIYVRQKHELRLSTLEINMPARADCTGGDRLLISRRDGKRLTHLTVLCGNQLFSPYTIRGAQRVRIEFTSDSRREGRYKLRYVQIPFY